MIDTFLVRIGSTNPYRTKNGTEPQHSALLMTRAASRRAALLVSGGVALVLQLNRVR